MKYLLFAAVLVSLPALADVAASNALDAFHHQDYRRATTDFEALVRVHRDDNRLLYDLARSQYKAGDIEDASATVRKLIERDPKNSQALSLQGLVNLAMLNRVNIFRKLGFARRALADWQRAVQISPDDVFSRYELVSYYAVAPRFAGGDVAKAKEQLEAIESLDPAWGDMAASVLDLAQKNYKSAEDHLKHAAGHLNDSALPYFALANYYLDQKRYAEALTSLTNFYRAPKTWLDPEKAAALYLEGNIRKRMNDTRRARLAFNKALRANPTAFLEGRIKSSLRKL